MRMLVLNPHSSTGKTTTALNLSLALAREGVPVQLVDADPKGVLTRALLQSGLMPSGPVGAQDSIKGRVPGFRALSFHGPEATGANSENIAKCLPQHTGNWQILDTASAAINIQSTLVAESDLILVPVKPEAEAFEGLSSLISDLQSVGMPLSALRILIAQYSNRILGHRIIRSKLIDRFGSQAVVPVVIRTSGKLSSKGDSAGIVFEDAPRSTGASDYAQLARSLLSEQALVEAK